MATLVIGSAQVIVGELALIPVVADSPRPFRSVLLRLVGPVVLGILDSLEGWSVSWNEVDGELRLFMYNPDSSPAGAHHLFTVQYAAPPASVGLVPVFVEVLDSDNQPIEMFRVSGNLFTHWWEGDLNHDGRVNVVDLLLFHRRLAGLQVVRLRRLLR